MKTRNEHIAMIRQSSQPMAPLPTEETALLQPLRNVEAVLLDVYGTFLISASGEIGAHHGASYGAAFCQAMEEAGLALMVDGTAGVECLRSVIHEFHDRSQQAGIDFPEVDIVEVWRATLEQLRQRGQLQGRLDDVDVPTLSLQYELLTNPVWPMPGAADCLMELANRGIRLGLISNAQWFTPLLFPALLGGELDAMGIGADMQFWSWRVGWAKPGQRLFQQAAEALQARDIAADHVLHVGNDLLNDVLPAAATGFRTALFAGDRRSLLRREGDARVASVQPDIVVLRLHDLLKCIRPVGAS